jgi:hypothetical protein
MPFLRLGLLTVSWDNESKTVNLMLLGGIGN